MRFVCLLAILGAACGEKETKDTGQVAASEAATDAAPAIVATKPPHENAAPREDAAAKAAVPTDGGVLATLKSLDKYGPSIAVKDEWRRCEKADDCTLVYSSCGFHKVVVNKASKAEARGAYEKACVGRSSMGVLASIPEFECLEGRCREGRNRALDEALGRVGGLSEGPRGIAPKRPPQARLFPGQPVIAGDYDSAIVRRLFRSRRKKLLACYERGLARNPKLAGTTAVTLTVGKSGKVSRSKAAGLGNKAVEACMSREAKKLRFPKPKAGAVKIEMPIKLAPPP